MNFSTVQAYSKSNRGRTRQSEAPVSARLRHVKSFLIRALKAVSLIALQNASILERSNQSSLGKSETYDHPSNYADIILTTFADRFFSHALPTLEKFQEAGLERRVFLVVNGDQGKLVDTDLRRRFLQEALKIFNVEPICFGTGRGMSEMWNAGARYSDAAKLIFLNEDLVVDPESVGQTIKMLEDALESDGLVILNQSFGHFGVTREALESVGWFDERFLGFGEEDGDFLWRYVSRYNRDASFITHHGLANISSEIGYHRFEGHKESKYSAFNFTLLRLIYSFSAGPGVGSFGSKARLTNAGSVQYPYERFRRNARKLLHLESGTDLERELQRMLNAEDKL